MAAVEAFAERRQHLKHPAPNGNATFIVREWCRQDDQWVSSRWCRVDALTAFAACHVAAQQFHLSFDDWAGETPTVVLRVGATMQEAR
jgi:anti-sigma-K factor RskA